MGMERPKTPPTFDLEAPPELVELANANALELFYYRTQGRAVSMAWRRIPAETFRGTNRVSREGEKTCPVSA